MAPDALFGLTGWSRLGRAVGASLFVGTLATVIAALWRRGRAWRAVAASYAVLVLAAFVFFYPTSAAVPLTKEQFEARLWIESWC